MIIWFVVDNNKRRTLLKELEAARKIMETASQHDFLTGITSIPQGSLVAVSDVSCMGVCC